MTLDSSLVDQIVRGVLHELEGAPNAAAPSAAPGVVVASPAAPASTTRLTEPVITAEIVSKHVPPESRAVLIGLKAILTPAALDVLRVRKLRIERATETAPVSGDAAPHLAVVVRATPALDRLFRGGLSGWNRQLLGCPDEAARLVTASLCRGDAQRAIIFAAQPYRAACLSNRNERVKAVAVNSFDELKAAREQLRVNVICLDPTNRGDFEIRRWLDAARAPAASKPTV